MADCSAQSTEILNKFPVSFHFFKDFTRRKQLPSITPGDIQNHILHLKKFFSILVRRSQSIIGAFFFWWNIQCSPIIPYASLHFPAFFAITLELCVQLGSQMLTGNDLFYDWAEIVHPSLSLPAVFLEARCFRWHSYKEQNGCPLCTGIQVYVKLTELID